jgi:hypothetical protein
MYTLQKLNLRTSKYIVEEWQSDLHAICRSVTNTLSTTIIMQHLHLFSFSDLSSTKQALALLIGLGWKNCQVQCKVMVE